MSKVENIEQEVKSLTPADLPLFANGFLSLTLKFGIGRSKRMLDKGS
jgi:hypothetical protein